MSGTMDMHTLIAAQSGWEAMTTEGTAFERLFPTMPAEVSAQWHAALTPTNLERRPKFRAAWAPGSEPLPIVVVQLLDDEAMDEPLGGYGGDDEDGDESESLIIREKVGITCITEHAELTRALHVALRAIMLTARPWFLDVGYTHFAYEGSQDIQPAPELLPEGLGVYMRMQRWAAISEVNVKHDPHHSFPARTRLVAATDATVAGRSGGVLPSTA